MSPGRIKVRLTKLDGLQQNLMRDTSGSADDKLFITMHLMLITPEVGRWTR